jgi:hypothetical protein
VKNGATFNSCGTCEPAVMKHTNLEKSVPSEASITTKLHENCSLDVGIRIWNKGDAYKIWPYPAYYHPLK